MIIPSWNKKHGFECLLLCPDKSLVIYESKFKVMGNFKNLINDALKTIKIYRPNRGNELQIAHDKVKNALRYREISFYDSFGKINNEYEKINVNENLRETFNKLSELSAFAVKDIPPNKEEYKDLFNKLFNKSNYVLYLGTKKQNSKLKTQEKFKDVELFEYSEEFDGTQ